MEDRDQFTKARWGEGITEGLRLADAQGGGGTAAAHALLVHEAECLSNASHRCPASQVLLLLVVEEQGCERLPDRDSGALSQANMTE